MKPTIYHTTLEVRGYELDAFAHVNHAVYLNYLEVARWNMLADEGITLKQFKEWKAWPVIASIDIQYKRSAVGGDVLNIETQLIEQRTTSMVLLQKIFVKGQLVTEAKVRSVVVDENGRPIRPPQEMQDKFPKSQFQSSSPQEGRES